MIEWSFIKPEKSSKYLQSLPQCQVTVRKNEYVIRTQPEEGFVSTLGIGSKFTVFASLYPYR